MADPRTSTLAERIEKLHAEQAARSPLERQLFDLSCLSTVSGYVCGQLRWLAVEVGAIERELDAARSREDGAREGERAARDAK